MKGGGALNKFIIIRIYNGKGKVHKRFHKKTDHI